MARIRTIKPEFWADEKLSPLSPIQRLVFLGLISMADDAGRVLDSPRAIDGFIFPETEDASKDAIEVLVDLGRLDRGVTASGQRILQIVNWSHQKIDKPNLSAALPPIVILDESSRRRRSIPAKLRDAILERDNYLCQGCGSAVRRDKRDRYDSDPDLAEIDHIVPVRDGGTNDPQNLRTYCLACNRKKAGGDVRRRNAEGSSTDRRRVADSSAPHINDLRSVPTINDQRSSCSARAAPGELEVGFADAWRAYPKRAGSNPRHDTLKQWRTRRKQGADSAAMVAGTLRYAKFCDATGKTGTEYVMQAKRFFGPSRLYEEAWEIPAPSDDDVPPEWRGIDDRVAAEDARAQADEAWLAQRGANGGTP